MQSVCRKVEDTSSEGVSSIAPARSITMNAVVVDLLNFLSYRGVTLSDVLIHVLSYGRHDSHHGSEAGGFLLEELLQRSSSILAAF